MAKKRPQYINEIVKDANNHFRLLGIKDEGDNLFRFVHDMLLKKGMYEGYNFFKKKIYIIDNEPKEFLVLPTSAEFKEGKWDCLQLF